jgi:hypothetical protein
MLKFTMFDSYSDLCHSPSLTSQFQFTHLLWQHSTHLVIFVALKGCIVSAFMQSLPGDAALGAMTACLSIWILTQKAWVAWMSPMFSYFSI